MYVVPDDFGPPADAFDLSREAPADPPPVVLLQDDGQTSQEEPSEPSYGTFLLSNDAPDLNNPGYCIDTRAPPEDGFVQLPPTSRKRKYISQRKTNVSLSSQTTAVLERRRLDRSQSVVGVQQWKERQEDSDAL